MIKIILVDDHPIIRQGLRGLLEMEPDLKVIAEANDGQSALHVIEENKADLVILDISMPGLNGLDVAHRITKDFPKTKVIVLSMHSDESYVLKALRDGAKGYVLKASATEDLLEAVRTVLRGEYYFSHPISQRAASLYVEKARSNEYNNPYELLTDREREVLQLSAEGYTAAQIAEKLFLSQRTVEMHRANFMSKLNLHNQTELIRFAIRYGILPPD